MKQRDWVEVVILAKDIESKKIALRALLHQLEGCTRRLFVDRLFICGNVDDTYALTNIPDFKAAISEIIGRSDVRTFYFVPARWVSLMPKALAGSPQMAAAGQEIANQWRTDKVDYTCECWLLETIISQNEHIAKLERGQSLPKQLPISPSFRSPDAKTA